MALLFGEPRLRVYHDRQLRPIAQVKFLTTDNKVREIDVAIPYVLKGHVKTITTKDVVAALTELACELKKEP
jgi:hypothetical protein